MNPQQQELAALCLFIFIDILIPVAKVYASLGIPQGNGYLEPCSDKEPCLSAKWLSCQDGLCQCTDPEEIIYDPDNDQCSVLAGHSCRRSVPDSNNDSSRYYTSCVPHAKCSYPEDECHCDFRYYKAANSTCVKQLGYGEPCSVDENCDQFQFLSCISGSCQCDAMHRYDSKNQKCYVPVGSACKIMDFKSISEENYKDDECPEHSTCTDAVCVCDEGFKICSDKTCGRDYGYNSCSTEDKCSDIQFSCRNQECQCKFPLHQFYDEASNQCISLVTGPCTGVRESRSGINITQTCSENAICHETPAYNFCRCKDGYVETNDGHCVKAYGVECEFDDECDNLPPLACVENVCSCPDKLQVFDNKTRVCTGLAGARCLKDMNSTINVCTHNAVCVKTNPQMNFGKCICVRGSTATAARTCIKS